MRIIGPTSHTEPFRDLDHSLEMGSVRHCSYSNQGFIKYRSSSFLKFVQFPVVYASPRFYLPCVFIHVIQTEKRRERKKGVGKCTEEASPGQVPAEDTVLLSDAGGLPLDGRALLINDSPSL